MYIVINDAVVTIIDYVNVVLTSQKSLRTKGYSKIAHKTSATWTLDFYVINLPLLSHIIGSYSTIVLNIGIMEVWGFQRVNYQLNFYFWLFVRIV